MTRAGLWLVDLIDRIVGWFFPDEPRNDFKEWL